MDRGAVWTGALAGALLITIAAPAVQAQESSTEPATLEVAQALFGAQEWTQAAAVLERVTVDQPDNAAAWAMLGRAYHSAGDYEAALPVHMKAAQFEANETTALYNAASTLVRLERADEAFEWLGRAQATGKVNMTRLLIDPDFAALQDDVRIQALVPSAEAFADPFVESVTIIHDWAGEAKGDVFGWIARNIGDVDGDGFADVAASAPFKARNGRRGAGRAYAYSGRTGALLWTRDGEPGDQLGFGIEAAGDVNADGVRDVVVGAPGNSRVDVYSGVDGSTVLTIAGQEGERFGSDVTTLEDANGDGHADLLIGAPNNGVNGEGAGAAYIVSGADGTVLVRLYGEKAGDAFGSSTGGGPGPDGALAVVGAAGAGDDKLGRAYVYKALSDKPAFVIHPDVSGGSLGSNFVSVVGDIDADGVSDIYASDFQDTSGAGEVGKIYIHSGVDGRRLLTIAGTEAGEGFGIGPSDAGDVDGDGHDDLVVGAWQNASAAPSGGKIYVYSGADGTLLWAFTNKVAGETLGFDSTGMGDIDGDGTPDFLVTSAWSSINGGRSGRMFIVSGKPPADE